MLGTPLSPPPTQLWGGVPWRHSPVLHCWPLYLNLLQSQRREGASWVLHQLLKISLSFLCMAAVGSPISFHPFHAFCLLLSPERCQVVCPVESVRENSVNGVGQRDTWSCTWFRCLGFLGRCSPPNSFWGHEHLPLSGKGLLTGKPDICVTCTSREGFLMYTLKVPIYISCLALLIHYLHYYKTNFLIWFNMSVEKVCPGPFYT